MKITEEIKNNTTFLCGKLHGLNNREAARLYQVVPEGLHVAKVSEKALKAYIGFCKEPRIDKANFSHVKEKDGVQKSSRSKIVMEYERHRKLFISLVKARSIPEIKGNFDSIFHKIVSEQEYDNCQYHIDDKKSILTKLLHAVK